MSLPLADGLDLLQRRLADVEVGVVWSRDPAPYPVDRPDQQGNGKRSEDRGLDGLERPEVVGGVDREHLR
jgi:hypothetical protein